METKDIKKIQEFVEEIKKFDEESTVKMEIFEDSIDIYDDTLHQTDVERIILYTLAIRRHFYFTNVNEITYLHVY